MTKMGMKYDGAKVYSMKRTRIKPVSKKQAKRNHELAKIEPPSDGRCEECHRLPDFRGLAKHHKLFRSHGGKDNEQNLIWLCGKCHSKAHGINEV